VSLYIALLAAPFGLARCVDGYANEGESDHDQQDCNDGIAPDFRTLSIGGMMTSEVCNAKEAIQR
jgi:hypothetical protein